MRGVASSSPSAKRYPPETRLVVQAIRPHPSLGAGVSVFARVIDDSGARDAGDRPSQRRGARNRYEQDRGARERPLTIRFDIDRGELARAWPPVNEDEEQSYGRLRLLERSSERTFVVARAVTLLAAREHSAAQLQLKLKQRGFSDASIAWALTRLEQEGAQDDSRFAESWIRSRMRRGGVGRQLLLAGLQARGIGREMAHAAIDTYLADNPAAFVLAIEAAAEAIRADRARHRSRGDATEEKRDLEQNELMRRLSRRGFTFNEIRSFLELQS